MANEPTLDTVFKRVDPPRAAHVPPPAPRVAEAAPPPAAPPAPPPVEAPAPAATPPNENPFTMRRESIDFSSLPSAPPSGAASLDAAHDAPSPSAIGRYPFYPAATALKSSPTAEELVDWLIACVMPAHDATLNPLPMIAAFLEEAGETVRERARERLRRVEEETAQLQSLLGGAKPVRKKGAPALATVPTAGATASPAEPQDAAIRAQDRQAEEDRVLEYLRLGQLDRVTSRRIAESTGYAYSQAGYILQRLREKGLVTVSGRGMGALWSLTPAQSAAQGTPS